MGKLRQWIARWFDYQSREEFPTKCKQTSLQTMMEKTHDTI